MDDFYWKLEDGGLSTCLKYRGMDTGYSVNEPRVGERLFGVTDSSGRTIHKCGTDTKGKQFAVKAFKKDLEKHRKRPWGISR